jgi:outer membrane protein OmpA-like peptidoglycan-associated protein
MTHFARQRDLPAPAARIGWFTVALLGLLAGCGAPPTAVQREPAAPPPVATKTSLVAEKQRLATALQGTPAVLALQADDSLRVDMPLRSCFDRGRATVKPPLAKVLDRMAVSQRNETTRLLVTAPTDPGANALALAMQRAVTARDYLVERGLDASRFSVSAVAHNPTVKIVIMASASP